MTTKLEKAFEKAEDTIDSLREERKHLKARVKELEHENEQLRGKQGDGGELEELKKQQHEREWRAARGLSTG